MAKLTGQSIASSYDQVVIVDDSNGITSSLQPLESADTGGGVSALKIATNKVEVIPSAADDSNAFEVSKADGTAIITADSSAETVDIAGHDESAKGLKLGGTLITASATELNALDGVTTTSSELNVLDGDTAAGSDTIASTSNVIVDIGGAVQKKSVEDLEVKFEDYFARPMSIMLWNASSKYQMNNTSGQDLNDCESVFDFSDLGASTNTYQLKLYVHVTSHIGAGYNFQLQYDNAGSNGNLACTNSGASTTTINGTTIYETTVGSITESGLVKFNLHGWNNNNGGGEDTRFNKAWFWIRPNS